MPAVPSQRLPHRSSTDLCAVFRERRRRHPHADVSVGPPLDLGSTDSVRAFASSIGGGGGGGGGRAPEHPQPLHVLVNNAGANYLPRGHTPEGVCTLAQVHTQGRS